MFETAEVGNKLSKEEYGRLAPAIRQGLLEAQKRLATAKLSVIVVVGGVEGAGKSETVNRLLEWMDPRGIETHALWDSTEEERQRPLMWRFWRALPPKGRVGIFLGSWYTPPIIDRVFGRIGAAELEKDLDRIVAFERMLIREDTLVLKFWLHLSKKRQKKRLNELADDPDESWRLTDQDWKFFRKYDKFRRISERALSRTSTGEAPWHVVEGGDARYRTIAVTQAILDSLVRRLDREKSKTPKPPDSPLEAPKPSAVNIIRRLDYKSTLPNDAYETQLAKLSAKLARLTRRLRDQERSMLLVFEGADAAGKGGAIRRLLSAMDARNYRVISVAAPTDEERAHPYLWRFWRHLPRLGRVTIYDRSWYGRVLVERLEGFCAEADWQRAYAEINAFEEQLTDFGIIVQKFWLAITPEEQLRRFRHREKTPYKQYKITEEDWRNRKKWGAYEAAACDMVERTSTPAAPWALVPSNDKNWARVEVMKTVCRRLEKALRSKS